MKRWVTGVSVLSVLIGFVPQVYASANSSTIQVQIDGQIEQLNPPAKIVDDRTMVPLRGIFEKLGATVTWDAPSKTVTITKDSKKIQIAVGSLYAVINGFQQKLDVPAFITNDSTMVPLRFVSESLGADVQWDSVNHEVLIALKGLDTALIQNAGTTDSSVPLTYTKALDLAMSNSYPIKSASDSIQRAKEVLDNASDNVKYVPASGGNTAATIPYNAYAADNISYQSSKKAYEFTQDALAYGVKQAYNGVLQALETKKLADLQLQNAFVQQQVTQAKYQNGLESDLDIQQTNSNIDSLKANQASAEKTLDSAYQQLDQLLGLPTDSKPSLTDIPQMYPLGQVSVDTSVSQAESESPLQWITNQKVDLANIGLKLYTFNDPTADPYKAKEIDVNLATYNAADQQKQLDQTVRTLYYSIKSMEDSYNSLEANLSSAKDILEKTEALYNNGMAVQADVSNAQLSVESLNAKLFTLATQHDNALLGLKTPWVIATSTQSGTSSSSSNGS